MIPYVIFILLALVCYYRRAPKAMLVLMILFAVLRYDTGWDYMMYFQYVDKPSLWANPDTSRYPLFWRMLFRICHELHAPWLFMMVGNTLIYLIFYWAMKIMRLSQLRMVQAMIVYITWQDFYLASFGIVRQELAMAVSLVAFAFLQRRKYWFSIAATVVAVALHSSAIIVLLIYPVYYFRRHLNFKVILITSALFMVILVSLNQIVQLLAQSDIFQYEIYLKMEDNFGGSIKYVYAAIAIYLLVALQMGKKKWTLMERQCYIMAVSGIVGTVAVFLVGATSIFSRIFEYMTLYMIFILLPSFRIFKNRQGLTQIAISVLVVYFFVYLIVTMPGVKYCSSPYVPYSFIFPHLL